MATLFHLVCHIYRLPLVQILWDDSFPCTVQSGRMSCLLDTYGGALLQKHSTLLFTGTAFLEWRSCGWNRAGGKFLPVKSGCRDFQKQLRQFLNSSGASAGPSYSITQVFTSYPLQLCFRHLFWKKENGKLWIKHFKNQFRFVFKLYNLNFSQLKFLALHNNALDYLNA